MVNEGDEACPTNPVSDVFQQTLADKRRRTTDKCEVEAGGGKENVSGKNVENDGVRNIHTCVGWEHFSCERSKAKKFRQLADEEKQARIQGQWQQESPARECLEQVKCCYDTDCNESMMKKGFTALENGTWEEYIETFEDRRMGRRQDKEAFDLLAKDEVEQMSIVQEIMFKSTDCLRRIIAPVGGQGGVTMSYLCPNCNSFPWKTTFGGSLLDRSTPAGGVRFVEKSTIGSNRTGFWSCKQGKALSRRRSFKAHAIPQGLCENLINALKLLGNQQEDGNGLLQNIVTSLGKGSRKGLHGLRDFSKVDNHRALDVGELHRGTGTFTVRKPKVPEGGSDVTIRESPHELTSRADRSEHFDGVHRCQPH